MKRPPLLTWQEGLILVAFGTLLMVSAPSFAQTVLTVNGQCVPTTCSNTPPPIVCTPPAVLQNGVCVTPPPIIPPSGCAITDAPSQLGGNPPIPPTVMAATQVIAYRIQAKDIANKGVGVYQPSVGMTVAISASPCDLGPATLSTSGCYFNAPGQGPSQVLVRVASVNGYQTCKQPPGDPLYVNVAFTGYSNYGQPLTNFCIAAGKTHCQFQYRRDP